jgi:glycerol-3-phosphate dehydrogenase (NAD(P)+)
MSKIIVLGAGVMGSAFCFPPADAGQEVHLVGTPLDLEIIKELKRSRIHPKLKMELPRQVRFYDFEELGNIISELPDLIVIGVSSAGVDWALELLGRLLKQPVPLLMLTKGLTVTEQGLSILPRYAVERLKQMGAGVFSVGAVGGPCIAGELAARRETRVTFGYPDAKQFPWLDAMFQSDYYHINFTTDLIGLELCAAMKNFYALGVGVPGGQLAVSEPGANAAQMHNPSAGLFTEAVREMSLLVDIMKGDRSNVYGLAGVGDLYVTCQAGRNSRMGRLLGEGMLYSEAKNGKMRDETVEGAELALTIGPHLELLFDKGALDETQFPLTKAIIRSICYNQRIEIPWPSF